MSARSQLVRIAAVASAVFAIWSLTTPASAQAGTVTGLCSTDSTAQAPCSGGWYAAPVTLSWAFDPLPKAASCPIETFSADTAGTPVSCTADFGGGNLTTSTVTIRIDTTPPAVSGATPSRRPDRNGWYTHPVTFTFSGSDALSGIASCSKVTYSGPDSASAEVTGGCTDNAGNTALRSFTIKYKGSPPVLSNVRAAPGEHAVAIHWAASPDAKFVEVLRSGGRHHSVLVYRGRGTGVRDTGLTDGVDYHYRLIAQDVAGNRSAVAVSAIPGVPLLRLGAPERTIASAPVLSWRRVSGANYYNVQLFRNGRKILSAWPSAAGLELSGSWVYRGRRRHLTPSVYSWYVWPGFGRRADARYGGLLGHATFRVA